MTRYTVTPGWWRCWGWRTQTWNGEAHYLDTTGMSVCGRATRTREWRYVRPEDLGPAAYCRDCEVALLSREGGPRGA